MMDSGASLGDQRFELCERTLLQRAPAQRDGVLGVRVLLLQLQQLLQLLMNLQQTLAQPCEPAGEQKEKDVP